MVTSINFDERPVIGTAVYLDDQRFELLRLTDVQRRDLPMVTFALWLTTCPEPGCGVTFRVASRLGGKLPSRRCREHRKPGKLVTGRRKIRSVVIEPPIAHVIRTLRNAFAVLDRHFAVAAKVPDAISADMDLEVRKLVDLVCQLISGSPGVRAAFCNGRGIDPTNFAAEELLGDKFREWLRAPVREVTS